MSSRKRPLDVDQSEFGPISKRLHKLQIDPMLPIIPITRNEGDTLTELPNLNGRFYGSQVTSENGQSYITSSQSPSHNCSQNGSPYNPALGAKQNPIYFEANRRLFEAHQLRITRSSCHLSDRRRSN